MDARQYRRFHLGLQALFALAANHVRSECDIMASILGSRGVEGPRFRPEPDLQFQRQTS